MGWMRGRQVGQWVFRCSGSVVVQRLFPAEERLETIRELVHQHHTICQGRATIRGRGNQITHASSRRASQDTAHSSLAYPQRHPPDRLA